MAYATKEIFLPLMYIIIISGKNVTRGDDNERVKKTVQSTK